MINLNNADINSVIYNNAIVNSIYLDNVLVFSNSKIITIVFGNTYVDRVRCTVTTPKSETSIYYLQYSSTPVTLEIPYNSKLELYAYPITSTVDTTYTVPDRSRVIYPVTQDQTVTFVGTDGVRQYKIYCNFDKYTGSRYGGVDHPYGSNVLQNIPELAQDAINTVQQTNSLMFVGWSLTEDGEVLTELILTSNVYLYPIFQEVGSGLAFTLSTDGTYYICTGFGTNRDSNLIIPAGYNNLPVLEIANSAFLGGKTVGTGTIGGTMRIIPQSVTILNGVQKIGENAFYNCKGLTAVKMPYSVNHIGASAFCVLNSTPLLNVEIRGTLRYVGEYIFGYQDNIDVLRNNSAQRDSYGGYYLGYTIEDSGDFVEKYLLDISDTNTTVTVNSNTSVIGSGACVGNDNLKSIILNKYLKHICTDAFQSCPNLSQIYYDGTKEEWEKITKDNDWILWCPKVSVITCTDALVSI